MCAMAFEVCTPEKVKEIFSTFVFKKPAEDGAHNVNGNQHQPRGASIPARCGLTVTRPRDREAFFDRVNTFNSLRWFAKPGWLSPPCCARYGWRNVSADLLQCMTCRAFLSARIPSASDPQVYTECCRRLSSSLKSAHVPSCPWSSQPSPATYLSLPIGSQNTALMESSQTATQLHQLGDDLPVIASQTWTDVVLSPDNLDELVTLLITEVETTVADPEIGDPGPQELTSEDPEEENTSDKVVSELSPAQTSVLLAVCGWLPRENSSKQLHCERCNRDVGLWNYHSKHSYSLPEEVDEVEVLEIDDSSETDDVMIIGEERVESADNSVAELLNDIVSDCVETLEGKVCSDSDCPVLTPGECCDDSVLTSRECDDMSVESIVSAILDDIITDCVLHMDGSDHKRSTSAILECELTRSSEGIEVSVGSGVEEMSDCFRSVEGDEVSTNSSEDLGHSCIRKERSSSDCGSISSAHGSEDPEQIVRAILSDVVDSCCKEVGDSTNVNISVDVCGDHGAQASDQDIFETDPEEPDLSDPEEQDQHIDPEESQCPKEPEETAWSLVFIDSDEEMGTAQPDDDNIVGSDLEDTVMNSDNNSSDRASIVSEVPVDPHSSSLPDQTVASTEQMSESDSGAQESSADLDHSGTNTEVESDEIVDDIPDTDLMEISDHSDEVDTSGDHLGTFQIMNDPSNLGTWNTSDEDIMTEEDVRIEGDIMMNEDIVTEEVIGDGFDNEKGQDGTITDNNQTESVETEMVDSAEPEPVASDENESLTSGVDNLETSSVMEQCGGDSEVTHITGAGVPSSRDIHEETTIEEDDSLERETKTVSPQVMESANSDISADLVTEASLVQTQVTEKVNDDLNRTAEALVSSETDGDRAIAAEVESTLDALVDSVDGGEASDTSDEDADPEEMGESGQGEGHKRKHQGEPQEVTSTTQEPRRKKHKPKITRGYFHPLSEHRSWCPWVAKVTHPPTSEVFDDVSHSLDEEEQPGYIRYIDLLLKSNSPEKSKMVQMAKTTPAHESLRNIRRILHQWTSSKVDCQA